MKEHPLVAFTILAQLAVGAFLAQGLLLSGPAASTAASNSLLLANGPFLLLALLASLFHLGSPAVAYRAIANLGSSWLSREILFALLFTGLGGGYAALARWGSLPGGTQTGLRALVAVCGLGLILCMAKLYMLRTVPAWNHWLTPASFLATSLLLGSLSAGVAVAAVEQHNLAALRWSGRTGLLLLALALAFACLTGAHLARLKQPERSQGIKHPQFQRRLHRLRLALLLASALVMVLFQATGVDGQMQAAPAAFFLAFALALAGEVLGRYYFYSLPGSPAVPRRSHHRGQPVMAAWPVQGAGGTTAPLIGPDNR